MVGQLLVVDTFRMAKYLDWFQCMDRDRSGRLSARDVALLLSRVADQLGLPGSAPERNRLARAAIAWWQEICAAMDDDGDGLVDQAELIRAFDRAAVEVERTGRPPRWSIGIVRSAFEAMDTDADGYVTVSEYARYLVAIGSDADANVAFERLDLDGDGRLDLGELDTLFGQWIACTDRSQPGNLLLTGRLPR